MRYVRLPGGQIQAVRDFTLHDGRIIAKGDGSQGFAEGPPGLHPRGLLGTLFPKILEKGSRPRLDFRVRRNA